MRGVRRQSETVDDEEWELRRAAGWREGEGEERRPYFLGDMGDVGTCRRARPRF